MKTNTDLRLTTGCYQCINTNVIILIVLHDFKLSKYLFMVQ